MANTYWRYVNSLSTTVVYPASAVVSNKFYVFGGSIPNGQYSKATYVYDLKLDTWTQLADMPDVKAYGAAASLDGNIIVTGGLRLDLSVSTESFIYNVDTGVWSSGPTCPPIWGHTLVAHPERSTFYFFGGMIRTGIGGNATGGKGVIWEINKPLRAGRSSGSDTLSKTVYEAQLASTRFSQIGTMYSGMAFHSSNVVGNDFFHAGGNGGPTPTGIAQKWSIGDTKSVLPPGPVIGSWSASTKFGTTVFFHGGGSTGSNGNITSSNATVAFDTVLNTWSTYPNMESHRLGLGAGTIDGGYQSETTFPYEVRNHGTETLGTTLYLFGGERVFVDSSGNYVFTPTNSGQVYDTVFNTLSTLTMPLSITKVQAKADQGYIIIFGLNGPNAVFWRYNPLTDTYTNLNTYGSGMNSGGAVVVDDPTVYFFQQGQSTNPVTMAYNLLDGTWNTVGGVAPFVNRTDVEAFMEGSLIYYTTQGELYRFDTLAGTYTPRATAPITSPAFKITYYEGELHTVSQLDGTHWAFNDTTNTWRKLGRNTLPRVNMNIVATSTLLFFVGGNNASVVSGAPNMPHDSRNNESWDGTLGIRSIVVGGEDAYSVFDQQIPLSSAEVYNANTSLVTSIANQVTFPFQVYLERIPEYLL